MSTTPDASLTITGADFERMFHSAPISLWLEDYSALKALFATWRAEGVTDLEAHLRSQPALMATCSSCLKVLRVNQKTLDVFSARDQQDLVSRLHEVFRDDTFVPLALIVRLIFRDDNFVPLALPVDDAPMITACVDNADAG